MPRVTWPLQNGLPVIAVQLRDAFGFAFTRTLLADTGAGPNHAPFELVLSDADGQRFGSNRSAMVGIGGAVNSFCPVYKMPVEIAGLGFSRQLSVAAAPTVNLPAGLDGVAAFRLLNSFSYGNFGDKGQFGLETP